jgi:hypothetical protein
VSETASEIHIGVDKCELKCNFKDEASREYGFLVQENIFDVQYTFPTKKSKNKNK